MASLDRADIVATLRAAGCVFAEDEAALLVEGAAGDGDELCALLDRRVAGEPLEHVVGWAEFCGLRIGVGPGVFVPRPRTEALVAHALSLVGPVGAAAQPASVVEHPRDAGPIIVVDLCCGSGAIGAAIADALTAAGAEVELHAADIDPVAVAYAARAIAPYCGVACVGDLDAPLPVSLRGRVAILAANVPYVATTDIATLPREAREHEPLTTLDGGRDGLDVARRVLSVAPAWLATGGHVFVEVTPEQAPALAEAARANGLEPSTHVDDERDATILVATRR